MIGSPPPAPAPVVRAVRPPTSQASVAQATRQASVAQAGRQRPDGFVLGANLPWIHYGEFGANAWQPQGGLSKPANLAELNAALDKLSAQGIRHVRWWLLADGRAGVQFAPDGTPKGLDPAFFKDMDAAVQALRAHGMTATFAVIDFGWLQSKQVTNGVQTGGHADVIRDPAKRQAYMDQILKPILERYGHEKAIEAWDLINEPEWTVFGVGSANPFNVWPGTMRGFIRQGSEYVHRFTDQQATVGSASTMWLPLVKGLGLDFYEPHWYDHFEALAPLGRSVAAMKLDKPVILGEFPTKGSSRDARTILNTAQRAGYRGAMAWSVQASDQASDYGPSGDAIATWGQQHASILNEDRFERSR